MIKGKIIESEINRRKYCKRELDDKLFYCLVK